MKVIFDNLTPPFFLAHGGAQTQVLQTLDGLRAVGVDVETSRWWDGSQQADLIHCLGAPNRSYLDFAAKKGIPVVSTTLFTATCNRSPRQLSFQGAMISALLALPGIPPWPAIRSQLKWDCYRRCRVNVVGIEAEADVLTRVYGVPRERIRIVPLGLGDPFLAAGPGPRNEDYLITTGTITERKRSLELARMAIEAKVPVCFVGKPYDRTEPYWKAFEKLIDGHYVRHVSHTDSVAEMIRLLQTARGFVLSSDYENWCLSAHEAAACGLPLLLPDQRWSRERFGDQVRYLAPGRDAANVAALRAFYEAAPRLTAPAVRHQSWREVGALLADVYEEILATRDDRNRG